MIELPESPEQMPMEVVKALTAIGENLRILLYVHSMKKVRYYQILDHMECNEDNLKKRLNDLQNGNLLINYYEKKSPEPWYSTTDIFEKMITSAYEIVYD